MGVLCEPVAFENKINIIYEEEKIEYKYGKTDPGVPPPSDRAIPLSFWMS